MPVKNLVTFGSPKPATDKLKKIITNSNINHISYRNSKDIVTELPERIGTILNYLHTEDYVHLSDEDKYLLEEFDDHKIDEYIKSLQKLMGIP